MTTMHRIILAGLLLCTAVRADSSKEWNALREKSLKMGLDAERVEQALGQCRKNGLRVQECEALLKPVYTAQTEALPTECVFIRIEEGLAKKVDAPRIVKAAETRLSCLRLADRMIVAARPERGGEHRHMVMHTCMALESGLPEEVLQNIFNRPGGFRYGRMIQVIEAGETLQLTGLAPQDIQHVMTDFLDRDLSRGEVLRAVDYILAEKAKGRDFQSIHAELWVQAD